MFTLWLHSKVLVSPLRDIWQKWKNGEIIVVLTGKAVKEEIAVERDSEVPMNPMIALRVLKAILQRNKEIATVLVLSINF